MNLAPLALPAVVLVLFAGGNALAQTAPPSPIPSSSPSAGPSETAASPAAPESPPPQTPPSAPPARAPQTPASASGGATTAPEAYPYRFVPEQPAHPAAGRPQIFAVYLNAQTLHAQGPIAIKVQTSPNVVRVVNRNEGHDYAIPLIAPGDFEVNSKLPKIPFIAAGMTVKLEFVATGTNGTTTVVHVPVKLQ